MGQYKEEYLSRWRGHVSEQAACGKSVAVFCGEDGLRVWQFYAWKKRLRKPDTAAFVAVEVSRAEAPAQPGPSTVQMLGIEIRHRCGWLELDRGAWV
jgi:hypothetical protein